MACAVNQEQHRKLPVTDLILPGCLQRLKAAAARAGCHSHSPRARSANLTRLHQHGAHSTPESIILCLLWQGGYAELEAAPP